MGPFVFPLLKGASLNQAPLSDPFRPLYAGDADLPSCGLPPHFWGCGPWYGLFRVAPVGSLRHKLTVTVRHQPVGSESGKVPRLVSN